MSTGLDYVGHEDVLPYKTTQKQPIFNHLFDKFLVASDTTAGTIATAFYNVNQKNTPKCFLIYNLQNLTDCDKIWYILY